MMAVPVSKEPSLTLGRPGPLFRGDYFATREGTNYDVARDGEHFVMIRSEDESAPGEVRVVLNWFEELKRLLPDEE